MRSFVSLIFMTACLGCSSDRAVPPTAPAPSDIASNDGPETILTIDPAFEPRMPRPKQMIHIKGMVRPAKGRVLDFTPIVQIRRDNAIYDQAESKVVDPKSGISGAFTCEIAAPKQPGRYALVAVVDFQDDKPKDQPKSKASSSRDKTNHVKSKPISFEVKP